MVICGMTIEEKIQRQIDAKPSGTTFKTNEIYQHLKSCKKIRPSIKEIGCMMSKLDTVECMKNGYWIRVEDHRVVSAQTNS